MAIPIKAYRCQYGCGRNVLTSKQRMEDHEARCFYNPESRACKTCKHLDAEWHTVYNPHHGGDPGSTDWEYKELFCRVIDSDGEFKMKTKCDKWEPKD